MSEKTLPMARPRAKPEIKSVALFELLIMFKAISREGLSPYISLIARDLNILMRCEIIRSNPMNSLLYILAQVEVEGTG